MPKTKKPEIKIIVYPTWDEPLDGLIEWAVTIYLNGKCQARNAAVYSRAPQETNILSLLGTVVEDVIYGLKPDQEAKLREKLAPEPKKKKQAA